MSWNCSLTFASSEEMASGTGPANGDVPACKVVLASAVARNLLEEISNSLERLKRKPLLLGFLANGDPAVLKYAEWTQRTCEGK